MEGITQQMRNFITFLHDTKTEGGELAGKLRGGQYSSGYAERSLCPDDPMRAGCPGGQERLMLREDGHEYVKMRREAMEANNGPPSHSLLLLRWQEHVAASKLLPPPSRPHK